MQQIKELSEFLEEAKELGATVTVQEVFTIKSLQTFLVFRFDDLQEKIHREFAIAYKEEDGRV